MGVWRKWVVSQEQRPGLLGRTQSPLAFRELDPDQGQDLPALTSRLSIVRVVVQGPVEGTRSERSRPAWTSPDTGGRSGRPGQGIVPG